MFWDRNKRDQPTKSSLERGLKRFFEPHRLVPGVSNRLWWCVRCNVVWWTSTDENEQECPECGREVRCLGDFSGDEKSQRVLEALLWRR